MNISHKKVSASSCNIYRSWSMPAHWDSTPLRVIPNSFPLPTLSHSPKLHLNTDEHMYNEQIYLFKTISSMSQCLSQLFFSIEVCLGLWEDLTILITSIQTQKMLFLWCIHLNKKYSNSMKPMVFTERGWIGSFISKWPISEYLFLQISIYLKLKCEIWTVY